MPSNSARVTRSESAGGHPLDAHTRQTKERSVWARLANRYDAQILATWRAAYQMSIVKARAVLSPTDHVLEIGCGTGLVTLGIAPYVERVVAVDITPEMVALAREKAAAAGVSNVEFRVDDGYKLPYADGSFDAVLLFNVLHVVKEPTAVLHEANRLLKPAGRILSATDCYAEPAPLKAWLILSLQRLQHWMGAIPFLRYYRRRDLERLFEQCGFTLKETAVLQSVPINYCILGQKTS